MLTSTNLHRALRATITVGLRIIDVSYFPFSGHNHKPNRPTAAVADHSREAEARGRENTRPPDSVDLTRLREPARSSAIDAVIASIDVGLGLEALAMHRLTRRRPSAASAGAKARP